MKERRIMIFNIFIVLIVWQYLFMVAPVVVAQDSDQVIKNYMDNHWQDNRYIVHEDGTVTDTKTELMWKQCSEGLYGTTCQEGEAKAFDFEEAQALKNTSFAGYDDWRVPTIYELISLVAYDRYRPAINSTIFPNTQQKEWYWSASPSAYNSDSAWGVIFRYGYDYYSYDAKDSSFYVRLVRRQE